MNKKINIPNSAKSENVKNNSYKYPNINNPPKCNICSNDVMHPKICKYCQKIFCLNCINNWLKNHSFCKICNHQLNAQDIIDYSSIKINPEKENDNTFYKKYGNKIGYYCVQCNKNFILSNEEKITHIKHLVIPNLNVYEQKDIIIFIQELRTKLIELRIKLNEERNKNKIIKEKENKLKSQFEIDNINFEYLPRIKPININIIEYIDSIELLPKERPYNVIEERDSLFIFSNKKISLEVEYIDELFIGRNFKPENEIQIIAQIEILKTIKSESLNSYKQSIITKNKKMQEFQVVERDLISILSLQKEPLDTEYIDELFINGIYKPDNEIQLVDQMEVLKNIKPDNEIQYIDSIELLYSSRKWTIKPDDNFSMMIMASIKPENIIEFNCDLMILSKEKQEYEIENNCFLEFINIHNKNLGKEIQVNQNYEQIIKEERQKVIELNKKLQKYEKYSNNNSNLIEIIELMKELKEKKEEIIKIKSRYPFELSEGEEMMSIIISSIAQSFYYSIICKNTDLFVKIEAKLYNEYPNYNDPNNYFMVNGNVINKYKSLKDNNIHNSDIILLYKNGSIYGSINDIKK